MQFALNVTFTNKLVVSKLEEVKAAMDALGNALRFLIGVVDFKVWAIKEPVELEKRLSDCTNKSYDSGIEKVRNSCAQVLDTSGDKLKQIYETFLAKPMALPMTTLSQEMEKVKLEQTLLPKRVEPIQKRYETELQFIRDSSELEQELMRKKETFCKLTEDTELGRISQLWEPQLDTKAKSLQSLASKCQSKTAPALARYLADVVSNIQKSTELEAWMSEKIKFFKIAPIFDNTLYCVQILHAKHKDYLAIKGSKQTLKENYVGLEKSIIKAQEKFHYSPPLLCSQQIDSVWLKMEKLENAYFQSITTELARQTNLDNKQREFFGTAMALSDWGKKSKSALQTITADVATLKDARDQEAMLLRVQKEETENQSKLSLIHSHFSLLKSGSFINIARVDDTLKEVDKLLNELDALQHEKGRLVSKNLRQGTAKDDFNNYMAKAFAFVEWVRGKMEIIRESSLNFGTGVEAIESKLHQISSFDEMTATEMTKKLEDMQLDFNNIKTVYPPRTIDELCKQRLQVEQLQGQLKSAMETRKSNGDAELQLANKFRLFSMEAAKLENLLLEYQKIFSSESSHCDLVKKAQKWRTQLDDFQKQLNLLDTQHTGIQASTKKTETISREVEAKSNSLSNKFLQLKNSVQTEIQTEYCSLSSKVIDWIKAELKLLRGAKFDNTLSGAQKLEEVYSQHITIKIHKSEEKSQLNAYFTSLSHLSFDIPDRSKPTVVEELWAEMETTEQEHFAKLGAELERQRKLDDVEKKFTKEMKKHQAACAEIKGTLTRLDPVSTLHGAQVQIIEFWKCNERINKEISLRCLLEYATYLLTNDFFDSPKIQTGFADMLRLWQSLIDYKKTKKEKLEAALRNEERKEQILGDLNIAALNFVLWVQSKCMIMRASMFRNSSIEELLRLKEELEREKKELMQQLQERKQAIEKQWALINEMHIAPTECLLTADSIEQQSMAIVNGIENRNLALLKAIDGHIKLNKNFIAQTNNITELSSKDMWNLRSSLIFVNKMLECPTKGIIQPANEEETSRYKQELVSLHQSYDALRAEYQRLGGHTEPCPGLSASRAPVAPSATSAPNFSPTQHTPPTTLPSIPPLTPPYEIIIQAKEFFNATFTNFALDILPSVCKDPRQQAILCKNMWDKCVELVKEGSDTNPERPQSTEEIGITVAQSLNLPIDTCRNTCIATAKIYLLCSPSSEISYPMPGELFNKDTMQVFPTQNPRPGSVEFCVIPRFAHQKAFVFLAQS
ncbi:hypothetical protein Pelo_6278 [Pelomyxa schiedti]|nr:hypothetical protein Pelo_6278 [Pelomyxa schiedti]